MHTFSVTFSFGWSRGESPPNNTAPETIPDSAAYVERFVLSLEEHRIVAGARPNHEQTKNFLNGIWTCQTEVVPFVNEARSPARSVTLGELGKSIVTEPSSTWIVSS